MSNTQQIPKPKIKQKIRQLNVKVILVVIVLTVISAFATMQYQENQRLKTVEGQQELTKQQIDDVKSKVGKLIILPDEEPVVASIENVKELKKTQPFYVNVSNGDWLLVFQESKRAIIYSPERDILVNVGSLDISSQRASEASQKTKLEE